VKSDDESLRIFGWDQSWDRHFRGCVGEGLEPGRIFLENKGLYRIYTAAGELTGEISGKLRFAARDREQLPAVGDWAVLRARRGEGRATIHALLPRRSQFIRKAAGERTEAQIVGVNIDTVLLVTSLNHEFNLRRMERYLAVAWESGASPAVVLTKADLCNDPAARVAEMSAVAPGVPIHVVSVVTGEGLGQLERYSGLGRTIALLGSSGVGKSTLINRLLGREHLRVREVREGDDRGRHTTTHRELILLPGGGLVLDTPGMRELQLWDAEAGVQLAFDGIEALAANCYFSDCRHRDEPRCAVREALADGKLDQARFYSYEKLQREVRHFALRQDARAQRVERERWKQLTREAKERSKAKRGGG
jgi:ribosome biogenesis GTPase / thiamine phosphate phosphatase